MNLLSAPLAIVDLETTGGEPGRDRITEIAVIEVDNFEVTSEWSTLVNPGAAIPGVIQLLTGITNEMVAAAPTFRSLAPSLFERLAGRVFIAHNARFDYGFLRREFERAGLKFTASTLCTVRLSRRLYGRHGSHSLDSLIDRHDIDCRARHRAFGDADALWQFLRIVQREHGEEILSTAARQVARTPALPAHIDRALIDEIPETPGVYVFYGAGRTPLYVGKSVTMRSRVLSHFCFGPGSRRAAELAREVQRIDWERTAGELGALLREAALVKALDPSYNRQLRRPESLCGFVFDMKRLRLAQAHEIRAETFPHVYGLFRSRRDALRALRGLADEHRLCLQVLGFDPARNGPCFRHQVGKCAGACVAKENIHAHHARVATALAGLKAAEWPHRGRVGIVERDAERERTEIHVVDRWCYLGTARSEDELAELSASAHEPRFDYDHYRILARHLGRKGVRTLQLPCTPS